ncbi:MAG: hypothetical protein J0H74_36510 [Chitinophagaceae bacterium]|nr:hypothetical protein [Chitinophagaceae bacterium]
MHIKKYLPIGKYTLTSRLPVEEVKRRLADNIDPKRGLRLSTYRKNSTKPYEGEILGNTFTISRVIDYKNSFLPVIKGNISTFSGKTKINIKIRPVLFVLIFMTIWLGVVGLVCLGIIFTGLAQIREISQHRFSPMLLIPFAMFIFGCLLITLSFKTESERSKKFLLQLWEAQETQIFQQ